MCCSGRAVERSDNDVAAHRHMPVATGDVLCDAQRWRLQLSQWHCRQMLGNRRISILEHFYHEKPQQSVETSGWSKSIERDEESTVFVRIIEVREIRVTWFWSHSRTTDTETSINSIQHFSVFHHLQAGLYNWNIMRKDWTQSRASIFVGIKSVCI